MTLKNLLRELKKFDCHLIIYPRVTRTGVIYKMSIRYFGEAKEMCSIIARIPEEFDSKALLLLVKFHQKADALQLYPVDWES